ncbi:MAG: PAS domain S-box protein [Sedimentisphaerales bacterium]
MTDSDKTKEQLIQEIELLRTLIDALPDRLYVKDTKSRFVICNKAVAEDTDLPFSGDPIGKSDFDLFPPELASTFYAAEQEIIRTGKPMFNEELHRTRRKDGQDNWSLCTKLPWRDKNGNIIGVIGTNRDITKRKMAEQALQESETRYKAIFESAREGILVVDIETKRLKFANPAFCKMFGYATEELARMTINDIHPGKHLPDVLAEFEAQARGEKTLAQNVPCLHRDGTIFYADIDTTCVIIDQRPCNVGLFTDITERKHAEEALRESEARYKAIFESTKEGIIVADIETKRFMYSNPAICKMFGYTEEELSRMSINDIHLKEYQAEAIRHFEDMTCGKRELSHNVPCLRKDGTIFYADVNAIIVSINNKLCNVGLFTDITERKHAEEALRESEEKFRGLAERSFDIIFTMNADGYIKYISPACERILAFKPEEMIDKSFKNFVTKSYLQPTIKYFTGIIKGHALKSFISEVKRKDNAPVFIEANMSPLLQDGKVIGVQGVVRDITERRKAEEQLRKAQEGLEIRVKQRTADLAGVVEDLQNEIAERKRAEESLRNAEERFRTIFENTVVGLYRTTPDGRILMANPALIKMMGCRSFKELAKFNVEKNGFDPSTPRSIFKERIKKEGRIIGLEFVWRRPDGTKLFVSESAFAVKDSKGKIVYYEGTAQDITKRKEAEAKLMLYQQQLRSLASELSLAEERLRRRIAAELHDHIAQNLAISKIKLESLTGDAEPDLVKSLNEVNGLISQTIEATRSLTFEISPPVLYELGFEAAVNWLAKQTRRRFGLEVEFADDGKPKPLNTDIRVLLFQAVRELLVNVVKHARAKKAKVSTCRIQKNIQITVEDNGVGFDAEAISSVKDPTKGGFGLFNIRERLDQIGGSVIINAKAGKGTRITLTAPIEKQEKPRTRFSGARSDKNRKRRKKKERSA